MPSSSSRARRGLQLVEDRAAEVAINPGRLRALADRASGKLAVHRDTVGELRTDVPVLVRFVRAYLRGDYRKIPWRSLVLATGALVYFVTPADMIPDVLAGVGFLDDAAVLAYVVKSLRDHLDAFAAWEAGGDELAS